MKKISLLILFLVGMIGTQAQNLYYVFFMDKANVKFDPYEYFDAKAIERRVKHKIPLFDETDKPLNQTYVDAVQKNVEHLRYQLRWFNAVTVRATDEQIAEIQKMSFVKSVEPFQGKFFTTKYKKVQSPLIDKDKLKKELKIQRKELNLKTFVDNKINGKGVRIAVFDDGFMDVDKHEAFKHLRDNGSIKMTKDFFGDKDHVYHHDFHGTACLSCIAGKVDEQAMGAATGAEFILARTEHKDEEEMIEEDNWLAAVEWADKNGADIISSSLGYTEPRYKYKDMDGEISKVSGAARLAIRKGILVVNAAGNSGAGKWHYINTPADVDSVLTVGGTKFAEKSHIFFGSYGPNSKNQLKPDVSAPAYVYTAMPNGQFMQLTGTSFSCPQVSGFAACLMQKYPNKTNMEIWEMIRKSGHLYPYYDYALGYGVPNANYFFDQKENTTKPMFKLKMKNKVASLKLQASEKSEVIYYHVSNKDGVLSYYSSKTLDPGTKKLELDDFSDKSGTLKTWYRGTILEVKL